MPVAASCIDMHLTDPDWQTCLENRAADTCKACVLLCAVGTPKRRSGRWFSQWIWGLLGFQMSDLGSVTAMFRKFGQKMANMIRLMKHCEILGAKRFAGDAPTRGFPKRTTRNQPRFAGIHLFSSMIFVFKCPLIRDFPASHVRFPDCIISPEFHCSCYLFSRFFPHNPWHLHGTTILKQHPTPQLGP